TDLVCIHYTLILLFLFTVTPVSLKNKQKIRQGYPTILYSFDTSSFDSIIEYRLRSAMNKIEQASCVRFEPEPEDGARDYSKTLIIITNPSNVRECNHEPLVDQENNSVQLILGLDCLQERDILHSLLHALGFKDEVSHPQRDRYIRVMWNNIHPKYRNLFRIQVNEFLAANPVEYDPLSIMQFHERAFSYNGQPTIVPVTSGLNIIPSNSLSALDKMKLRMMFGAACNQKKLTELMDSCKMSMRGERDAVGPIEKYQYDEQNVNNGYNDKEYNANED
ncbi:seminal metalloprotease 1-like, partial [Amyelois transitella]|uniref:seminal metalloprotease 1-like n=1 Tax=Amyelois transitella TaxID=680683 RepID=UPI00299014ED